MTGPSEPDEELIAFATRLVDLARRGESESLCADVDAGVSPNLCNQTGDTLLMLAAYHGQADAVRALAWRGADPDCANDRGQTPLAGAVFKDEPDVIRTLVAAGADPRPVHRQRSPPRRCSSVPISPRCWPTHPGTRRRRRRAGQPTRV